MNPSSGRFWGLAAFVAILSLLTGCASVTQGTTQTMKIETLTQAGQALPGAECSLNNDKATSKAVSGRSAQVRRSGANLVLHCTLAGQPEASGQAVSRANAGLAGNLLLGSALGAAIDVGTGAAYTYPTWIRLVFGEDRLFDRSGHRDDGPVAGTLVRKMESDGAPPAPAVAAISQAFVVAKPLQSPEPVALAPGDLGIRAALKQGDALEYSLTDAMTGNNRLVTYRLERIEARTPAEEGTLIFNGGGRVERHDGRVVSIAVPVGGYFDSSSPPGGWGRKDLKPGMQWHSTYMAFSGQKWRHDVDVTVLEERSTVIGGVELRVLEIAYKGWIHAPMGSSSSPVGTPFEATVLYAPDLGRTVKFAAKHRRTGGILMAQESMELVRVVR